MADESIRAMIYLKNINKPPRNESCYPHSVPSIAAFGNLEIHSPVVFLVGANASGKSTLLESLAIASKRVVIGGESLELDKSLNSLRPFARDLKLSWNRKTSKGFFLRAEDFFNFSRKNNELAAELQGYADDYADNKFTRQAMLSQKRALDARYGDLEKVSHGEGFLKVFQSRIVSGGLYMLDEPEAALSPQSQLALMYQMREMINHEEGSQFIIATHSPILMSFPDAQIMCFDDEKITETPYEEVGHIDLYKRFLSDPKIYLDRLFEE